MVERARCAAGDQVQAMGPGGFYSLHMGPIGCTVQGCAGQQRTDVAKLSDVPALMERFVPSARSVLLKFIEAGEAFANCKGR
jgi:hypothetical protein